MEETVRGHCWHHKALPSDAKQWSRGTDFFYPYQATVMDSFLAYLLSSSVWFCRNRVTFLYVDIRHIESLRRMWCRNDVNFKRLGDRVTCPPIHPTYWRRVLLFLTTPRVGRGHAGVRFGRNRGKPCLVCEKYSPLIFEYGVPVPYTTLSRFLQFPTALRS